MTLTAGKTGRCPHCRMPNRFERVKYLEYAEYIVFDDYMLINGSDSTPILLDSCRCTNCGNVILRLDKEMIYPFNSKRPPAPKGVPQAISDDFNEACLVEHLSKKAAAALARRCLQNMLRDQGFSKKTLYEEIGEAMEKLPSHLSESIDAIRNVGNLGTHPMKSQVTGDIVDVGDGETEWILDVLEQLFDFYYVQPVILKTKRAALDKKLGEIGKPPMK